MQIAVLHAEATRLTPTRNYSFGLSRDSPGGDSSEALIFVNSSSDSRVVGGGGGRNKMRKQNSGTIIEQDVKAAVRLRFSSKRRPPEACRSIVTLGYYCTN